MPTLRIQVAGRSWRSVRFSAAVVAIALAGTSPAYPRHLRSTTGHVRSAPKAVTPFTSFNFGDVYAGEVISQIFIIKNEGDAELQIKDFTAG